MLNNKIKLQIIKTKFCVLIINNCKKTYLIVEYQYKSMRFIIQTKFLTLCLKTTNFLTQIQIFETELLRNFYFFNPIETESETVIKVRGSVLNIKCLTEL